MKYLATFAVAILAACLYAGSSRYRLVTLRWPSRQGYAQMLRRIGKYMALKGWTVPEFHGAPFDSIVISKARSADCIVKCVFLQPDTRRLTVENFEAIPTFRLKQHTRLLVAADEVSAELVMEGRRRNIFVIYYKSLAKVARLGTASPEQFQAGLREIGDAYLSPEQIRELASPPQVTQKAAPEQTADQTAVSSVSEVDSNTATLGTLLAEASAALRRRDADDAVRAFQQARFLDPKNVGAASGLAAAFAQLGRTGEALELAKHAVSLKPQDPGLRTQYGHLLNKTGDFHAAERELRAALESEPTRAGALTGLSIALDAQGRTRDAIACQTMAVGQTPQQAGPHAQLGQLQLKAGEHDVAAASFRSALAIDPSHPGALGGLASTLRAQGKRRDAIDVIRQAGPEVARNADLQCRLAGLLEEDHQLEEAASVYEQALTLPNGHERAQAGLQRLRNVTHG